MHIMQLNVRKNSKPLSFSSLQILYEGDHRGSAMIVHTTLLEWERGQPAQELFRNQHLPDTSREKAAAEMFAETLCAVKGPAHKWRAFTTHLTRYPNAVAR